MTPDPRDELAALDKTPPGWTRADTDAMLDAAWARVRAERPGIQRGPLGQPLAWDNTATIALRRSKWRQEPA